MNDLTCFLLNKPGNLLPLPGSGRFQHCIGYIFRGRAICESGRSRLSLADSLQEVRYLVNEGVLVANLEPGDPPVFHVGMIAVGDVHTLPAAESALIAMIEIL